MAGTGPDQPDNSEDGREDTGPSAQRHVPIIQNIQKIAETPQVLRENADHPEDPKDCWSTTGTVVDGDRGSSSCRRRLSTRQVFVIHSPEDRVCPTGTGRGHDRRFPTCVTTPRTDNPDDAATTEVSLSQQLVRRGLARDGTETGPDRDNPEDCRQDTRTDRRDIFRSPRRSRSLSTYTSCSETEQIAQRSRRP